MRKFLLYTLFFSVIALLFVCARNAQAAGCTPFLVVQGGTGNCSFVTGTIPFGNGTAKIATSSQFLFTSGTLNLAVPYASTTGVTSSYASTTNLVVSSLGSSGTTCVQVNALGLLSSTGLACASGGAGFGKTWELVNGALTPTTTVGIIVNASSSITLLSVINGTTTNATSTQFFSTIASTSKLFGANLQSCNSASNALTWSAGTFGCNSIASAAFNYPFTNPTNYGTTTAATTTPLWFKTSFYASSTPTNPAAIDNLIVGSSTPVVYPNAPLLITGNVNAFTQVVLSNLNSGSTASADYILSNNLGTNTTYYGDLGFNSSGNSDASYTGFSANALYLYNNDAELDLATASTTNTNAVIKFLTGGTLAANERARITPAGRFGIGTTTPIGLLTLSSSTASQLTLTNGSSGLFSMRVLNDGTLVFATSTYTATSTKSVFGLTSNGGILLSVSQPSTSTAITLNWSSTAPQIEYQIGTAAVTINVINATTSDQWGSRKLVYICNPGSTAGALTWTGVEWIGSAPTQTTTANQCDVYSFDVTRATSTPSSPAYKVAGSAGAGFQ